MTEKIEIKRLSENEIHINDVVIKLLENNIIVYHAIGSPDEELANAIFDVEVGLLNEIQGKSYRLIDLNQAGKPSKKAREILQKLFFIENNVEKTAFVVGNPVAKIIASFIITFLQNGDIKLFPTHESAIEWFRSV
jgi:hypothetical protein